MLVSFVVLLIGFSVVGLGLLLLAYLVFFDRVPKTPIGTLACSVLCLALAGLQLEHLRYFTAGTPLLEAPRYLLLLFVTPVSFYFFSRELLLPAVRRSPASALHVLLPLAAWLLPAGLVAPAAFTIGAGYSLWLARVVHGMRRHVKRFRYEMFFFGLFAVLAAAVLGLVLALPWIGATAFHLAYAGAIGMGVLLVMAALLVFPDLLVEIDAAAKLSYANSTLKGVDVEASMVQLTGLMADDKLYRNENLSLAALAEAMGLSTHQLSELINTRFGVGFSRYVREQRVAEARRLLAEDRRSSALSIGMMCGFGSQSTFYAAFKEVTGQSPAAFRKQQAGAASPD